MNLIRVLREAFAGALGELSPEARRYAELVKPTQDLRFGDYQANCAMPLAKQLGRNPRQVANEICTRLDLGVMTDPPEVAGPGFINLRLSAQWMADSLGQLAHDERLAVDRASAPKTILIDFSSPNVAKPMHVGHIRSTIIGDSLARLLGFLGHRVITDNHIGDWGTQFGMLIFGYKYLLDAGAFDRHPVGELARLYRLVNWLSDGAELFGGVKEMSRGDEGYDQMVAGRKAFETQLRDCIAENPKLAELAGRFANAEELLQYVAEESRQETARLHAGDAENRALWDLFMPHCLAELERMYERLDVHFDHHFGESFYQPMLPDLVQSLLDNGIAQVSDGAVCVFLKPDDPPCLIRKRDGAFLYATTDLATVKHRVEQFNPNLMLYVVGQPQSLHFEQLFEVASRWGYSQVEFVHVSFGTVLGSDGRPFKSREGGTVGLEPLLDEGVQRARTVVDQNSPDLPTDARQKVAEAVGIGAIKYADLSVNRTSDYTFSWDKMMAMQGNTATYLQYAYARIQSIFRKGQVDPAELCRNPPKVDLSEPPERELALQLLRLPETLEEAAAEYRPHVIASYLYGLAKAFSSFFTNCPVLQAASPHQRASRLLLCDLTARTLRQGLYLLGIRTIDRM